MIQPQMPLPHTELSPGAIRGRVTILALNVVAVTEDRVVETSYSPNNPNVYFLVAYTNNSEEPEVFVIVTDGEAAWGVDQNPVTVLANPNGPLKVKNLGPGEILLLDKSVMRNIVAGIGDPKLGQIDFSTEGTSTVWVLGKAPE